MQTQVEQYLALVRTLTVVNVILLVLIAVAVAVLGKGWQRFLVTAGLVVFTIPELIWLGVSAVLPPVVLGVLINIFNLLGLVIIVAGAVLVAARSGQAKGGTR